MPRPKGFALNRDAFDDLIRRNGTTLTQIAEDADIPRATLSGLVGGHQRASVPMAHKLAAAMGCSVGTLFPTLGSSAERFAAAVAVA